MLVKLADMSNVQLAKLLLTEAKHLEHQASFHSQKERVNKLLQRAEYCKEAARRLNNGNEVV